jgi:hypothetical protein
MSFLRRRFGSSEARDRGTGAHTNGAPGIIGGQPCAHPGCINHNGVDCAYVDRRGRACGYSWCPEHQVVFDQDITALLEEIKEGAADAVVRTHPLHLVVLRAPPSRTWARNWTLGDHTGTMREVSVEVNEGVDNVVVASVDGSPVAREVPPWISDRGTLISDEAVQKRRDEFRIKLVGSIVWSAKNAERPWAPVP